MLKGNNKDTVFLLLTLNMSLPTGLWSGSTYLGSWQISCKNSSMVTFTEEILNGKFHFFCSAACNSFKFQIKRWSESTIKPLEYLTVQM